MPENRYEDIKIHGLKELEANFKSLPPKVQRKHVKRILTKAAETVESEVRRRAPKGRPPSSGWMAFLPDENHARLKDNIVHQVVMSKYGPYARVGIDYKKVHHGHLVEFGTKPHWIMMPGYKNKRTGPKWFHKGSQKKPFMRPAFDSTVVEVVYDVSTNLVDAIEREVEMGG